VKYGFSVVAGAIILYFAINSIHTELRKKHRRPSKHDTFVESKPAAQTEKKLRSEEEQKQESVENIQNDQISPTPTSDIADNEPKI